MKETSDLSGRATTALPLVLDASGIEAWAEVLSQRARGRQRPRGRRAGRRAGRAGATRLRRRPPPRRTSRASWTSRSAPCRRRQESRRRRQGAGVAQQVALARRESPHRGRQHLGLATVVARELPHTWAAWRTGRITEWKATIVARETACLSLADRLTVDEVVARDAAALEAMGERELAGACLQGGGAARRGRPGRPAPSGGVRAPGDAAPGAGHDDLPDRAVAGEGRRRRPRGARPGPPTPPGPRATSGPAVR